MTPNMEIGLAIDQNLLAVAAFSPVDSISRSPHPDTSGALVGEPWTCLPTWLSNHCQIFPTVLIAPGTLHVNSST